MESSLRKDSVIRDFLKTKPDLTRADLDELFQKSTSLNGTRQTIMFSKWLGKQLLVYGISKIGTLHMLKPENISIEPTSDEIAIIVAQGGGMGVFANNLYLTVIKNMCLSMVSENLTALLGESTPKEEDVSLNAYFNDILEKPKLETYPPTPPPQAKKRTYSDSDSSQSVTFETPPKANTFSIASDTSPNAKRVRIASDTSLKTKTMLTEPLYCEDAIANDIAGTPPSAKRRRTSSVASAKRRRTSATSDGECVNFFEGKNTYDDPSNYKLDVKFDDVEETETEYNFDFLRSALFSKQPPQIQSEVSLMPGKHTNTIDM